MPNLRLTILIISFCFTCHVLTKDSLTTEINPGCSEELCKNVTYLVYTKSVIGNDSLHFLWSTPGPGQDNPEHHLGSSPGLLLVEVEDTDAKVSIDWPKLFSGSPGSVSFPANKVKNAIAIILKDITIWDDTEKKATPSPGHANFTFDWTQGRNDSQVASFHDVSWAKFSFRHDNFSMSFNVSTRTSPIRHGIVPHLTITPHNFHTEVILKGKSGQEQYQLPRLLFNIIVVHSAKNYSITRTSRIDDEYSPGVFVDETLSLFSSGNEKKSYVNWKPVAYSKDDRIIAHTIESSCQNITRDVTEDENKSKPVFAFFSGYDHSSLGLTFAFGSPKDSAYNDTDYTSFSFSAGIGDPPDEGLSLLVKMVILVGFGLPAIALIASCLYLGVKKLRQRGDTAPLLQ